MGQHSGKHVKLPPQELRKLQRQVSFSEHEIKDWHREFVQSSSDRKEDSFLTEGEFIKVYNSVYHGQSDDFAKHIFRTFDLDGNGTVNFREFLIGMSFSGSSNFEKKLSWAFRVYDVDNSGFISPSEMRQIFRSVFRMIGPVIHNGVAQDSDAMADDIFQKMDTNGDQRISWEEFQAGASEHPAAVELLQCAPPEDNDPGNI